MFYPTPCRCGGLKDKRVEMCRRCRDEQRATVAPERFWKKVIKRDGCWGWIGTTHLFGYGQFRVSRPVRTKIDAHRYSWMLHFGPIPEGMQVLHKCDTPECVRPDHLFLGTHQDNMRDKQTKGRAAAGDTHGSRTHPEKFPGKPDNFKAHPPAHCRHAAWFQQ